MGESSFGDSVSRGVPKASAEAAWAIDYDAFVSYNHAADGRFSPRSAQRAATLCDAMGTVPMDQSSSLVADFPGHGEPSGELSAVPTIEHALAAAKWFVLLASPASAQSPWVGKEVDFWCRHKSLDRLLMVQTGGEIAWDLTTKDFDWAKTDAVPQRLSEAFAEDSRWVERTFCAHGKAGNCA